MGDVVASWYPPSSTAAPAYSTALCCTAGQKKDRKQRKEERKQRMAARKAERTGLPKQVGAGGAMGIGELAATV